MFSDFPNCGYMIETVPNEIFSSIKEKVSIIEQNLDKYNDVGYMLAGHLHKEVRYEKDDTRDRLENYLLELSKKYSDRYNFLNSLLHNQVNSELTLGESCWINFQQATDFNPVHDHSGVFSFVIYVNIPYLIEDQLKLQIGNKSIENLVGHFQFLYTDILGRICTKPIPVDKRYEGKILFFPSTLKHTVYPFYNVDGFRISIAGNILFK